MSPCARDQADLFPVRVVVVLLSGESLPDASRCVLSAVLYRAEQGGSAGSLGLPGAFRKADEDLDDTARRALELVNVRRPRKVEQIGTSADSEMVTVTYMATIDRLPMTSGHSTSTAVIPFTELSGSRRGNSPLQGQDSQTLDRAVEEVKVRLDSTPLALGVVPPVFTLGQLRSIYEDAWGKKLDHRNFRRKLLEGPKPFVKPVGASLSDRGTKGRPPELYEATREWNHETPIRLPRKRPRSTQ